MDFATKPTLRGERARLEPLDERHFDALWEAINDPHVLRFTGSTAHIDERRLREWLSGRRAADDRLDLAIIDVESGECVGEAVLNEVDIANRSCGFRILVGPRGQDRGLGTEATRLIVGYGFETLGLHRVSLSVFDFNPRARRAYEKVGFVAEGLSRETLWWDEEWHSSVNMSILEAEWREHRGHPVAPA